MALDEHADVTAAAEAMTLGPATTARVRAAETRHLKLVMGNPRGIGGRIC
jgi:hypothetical protein